jgi:hypothetical protein
MVARGVLPSRPSAHLAGPLPHPELSPLARRTLAPAPPPASSAPRLCLVTSCPSHLASGHERGPLNFLSVGAGVIHVTELSDDRVRGNFSGTLPAQLGQDPATVTLTGGTFDIGGLDRAGS